ncbi:MAG: tellurium resistance protein TerC [Fimbriimonadales bacterium]
MEVSTLSPELIGWLIFAAIILSLLYLDLGVLHRHAHEVKVKEALIWSGVWILVALAFNIGIYLWKGHGPAIEFLTGYVIERSLSIDNVFVFLVVFRYFQVPPKFQHRVLFWGVFGAVVLRILMILAGISLLNRFAWMVYVFGVLLIATGIRMAFEKDKKADLEGNLVIRLVRRMLPVTEQYHDAKFMVRTAGKLFATPLLVALIFVEVSDVVFAIDSIPAILAITRDPFIVYTSNVFAILGLRALYFAVAGIMDMFHYLHYGLSLILMFVGVKMLLAESPYKIPTEVSLIVVCAVLTVSILASVWRPRPAPTTPRPSADGVADATEVQPVQSTPTPK